jgi:hypothetical protein
MKNKKVGKVRKTAPKAVKTVRKKSQFSVVIFYQKFLKKMKKKVVSWRKLFAKKWKVSRRVAPKFFQIHKVAIFAVLFGIASVFATSSLVEFGKASLVKINGTNFDSNDAAALRALYRDCIEKKDYNSDNQIGSHTGNTEARDYNVNYADNWSDEMGDVNAWILKMKSEKSAIYSSLTRINLSAGHTGDIVDGGRINFIDLSNQNLNCRIPTEIKSIDYRAGLHFENNKIKGLDFDFTNRSKLYFNQNEFRSLPEYNGTKFNDPPSFWDKWEFKNNFVSEEEDQINPPTPIAIIDSGDNKIFNVSWTFEDATILDADVEIQKMNGYNLYCCKTEGSCDATTPIYNDGNDANYVLVKNYPISSLTIKNDNSTTAQLNKTELQSKGCATDGENYSLKMSGVVWRNFSGTPHTVETNYSDKFLTITPVKNTADEIFLSTLAVTPKNVEWTDPDLNPNSSDSIFIKSLDLSDLGLTTVPDFSSLTKLSEVNLKSNEITTFGESYFPDSFSLQRLDLSYNKITGEISNKITGHDQQIIPPLDFKVSFDETGENINFNWSAIPLDTNENEDEDVSYKIILDAKFSKTITPDNGEATVNSTSIAISDLPKDGDDFYQSGDDFYQSYSFQIKSIYNDRESVASAAVTLSQFPQTLNLLAFSKTANWEEWSNAECGDKDFPWNIENI